MTGAQLELEIALEQAIIDGDLGTIERCLDKLILLFGGDGSVAVYSEDLGQLLLDLASQAARATTTSAWLLGGGAALGVGTMGAGLGVLLAAAPPLAAFVAFAAGTVLTGPSLAFAWWRSRWAPVGQKVATFQSIHNAAPRERSRARIDPKTASLAGTVTPASTARGTLPAEQVEAEQQEPESRRMKR